MARTASKTEQVDYGKLVRALQEDGPQRLYMLRGEEDYLRDRYLDILRGLCVPEGLDSFNYHRLNGPKLDLRELSDAVESVPFMGERTLVEVRDFDINRSSDYDVNSFAAILADIPEWTSLVFVFAPSYAPDGRIAPVKALKKYGVDAVFTVQSDNELIRWVVGHFKRLEKNCPSDVAAHLLYVCGTSMTTLQQEIIKLAGLVAGESITNKDIDAVAQKQPETKVYEMTDALGRGRYDQAASMLADLLADRDETPSGILYMISEQMRRLYCAKLAPRGERGRDYMLECIPEMSKTAFLIPKLQGAAASYSTARLARAVELCAACEFSMRDGGVGDAEALRELLLRLAMDKNDD